MFAVKTTSENASFDEKHSVNVTAQFDYMY